MAELRARRVVPERYLESERRRGRLPRPMTGGELFMLLVLVVMGVLFALAQFAGSKRDERERQEQAEAPEEAPTETDDEH